MGSTTARGGGCYRRAKTGPSACAYQRGPGFQSLESRRIARPRLDRPQIALALLGLALVAAAILLAYWGRRQTVHSDELQYAVRLSTQSLGHAMLHPPASGYLIAAPMLVYRALFETVGLGDYAAQRAVAIALLLISAILFYALARRRVGDFLALAPTVLLLFFGYGSDVVLTADRIPGSMAVAAGLGMFLALDRDSFAGDLVAAILLTLSLASHPTGLAFAVGAAVLVVSRPSPWRWRSAWVFLVPVALYAAWWFFLRPEGTQPTPEPPQRAGVIRGSVVDSGYREHLGTRGRSRRARVPPRLGLAGGRASACTGCRGGRDELATAPAAVLGGGRSPAHALDHDRDHPRERLSGRLPAGGFVSVSLPRGVSDAAPAGRAGGGGESFPHGRPWSPWACWRSAWPRTSTNSWMPVPRAGARLMW